MTTLNRRNPAAGIFIPRNMTGQGGDFDVEETSYNRRKTNATVSTSRNNFDIAADGSGFGMISAW